jgi:hypothetical protein
MLRYAVTGSLVVCVVQYYITLAWVLLSVAKFRSCILVIISCLMLQLAAILDLRKYELQADIFTSMIVCRWCVAVCLCVCVCVCV